MAQVVQALAAGNRVIAAAEGATKATAFLQRIGLPLVAVDGMPTTEAMAALEIDLVAISATGPALGQIRRALAARPGPIVPVTTARIDPAAYCTERAICIDTTAAGGNASLLAETS